MAGSFGFAQPFQSRLAPLAYRAFQPTQAPNVAVPDLSNVGQLPTLGDVRKVLSSYGIGTPPPAAAPAAPAPSASGVAPAAAPAAAAAPGAAAGASPAIPVTGGSGWADILATIMGAL